MGKRRIIPVEESTEFRSDDPIVELIVGEEHGIFHTMMEDWKGGGYDEDILSFIDSDNFALYLGVVNPKIDVDEMREKLREKLFSMKRKNIIRRAHDRLFRR